MRTVSVTVHFKTLDVEHLSVSQSLGLRQWFREALPF